jgi:predicted GIY-YIG superfamily endonuclease
MGKTITTYLIDGTPNGVQSVFISNKVCQMYVIPRSNLKILSEKEELQRPAFYILLGEEDPLQQKAYIGQTENFRDRVKDHDNKKAFWQKALVFVSKDSAMTKADVQYLEYKAILEAQKAHTMLLDENKNTPKIPHLSDYQMDTMDEFFLDIKFLTSFIGCNIFDVVKEHEEHLFYTSGRGSNAKGFYNSNGFTVLTGSIIAGSFVKSLHWSEKRNEMIKKNTISKAGKLLLSKDLHFGSPSSAADFCIGSSNNGWIVWKDKKGLTLHEVYRKKFD